MPGVAQVYLSLLQRRASVCQRRLRRAKKKPGAEGQAGGITLSAATVSRCARRLWAAACHHAAAACRRAAVVCRYAAAVCRRAAAVYRRADRSSPVADLVMGALAVMLSPFFRRRGGLSAAKAHDDNPSVITAESKANFFIAISFLLMCHGISAGKSEDKMEKSIFGLLCIPSDF